MGSRTLFTWDGKGSDAAAAPASASLVALLGWQADTDIRLRDAVFFEPQRLAAEEVARAVFTVTTVASDYLQWSRTNNRFSIFIDAVESVRFSGNDLLIKGKVFGTMPMTARLSPSEARKGLQLLNFKLVLFLLTFLLR